MNIIVLLDVTLNKLSWIVAMSCVSEISFYVDIRLICVQKVA